MLSWIKRAFSPPPPANWEVGGTWTTHTVRANPFTAPTTVTFELPEYMKAGPDDVSPSFRRCVGEHSGDWFAITFGGNEPADVPESVPTPDEAADATEVQYERVLRRLREDGGYRVLDSSLPVKGATRALLCQEISDLAGLHQAAEEALKDQSTRQREESVREMAAEISNLESYLVEIFSAGRHVTVSIGFTKHQAGAKKHVMERFLRSLAIQD